MKVNTLVQKCFMNVFNLLAFQVAGAAVSAGKPGSSSPQSFLSVQRVLELF